MGKPQIVEDDFEEVHDELQPGHKLLQGQFTIDAFLNSGGFGITYLARNSLDRKVVIKECFPGAMCRRTATSVQARSRAHIRSYASVVGKFVDEAHSLAKVKHPNVVGVHQVFEDNKTAYMVLDFVEGQDLLEMIEGKKKLPTAKQVETILRKLLDAVGHVHKQDILHRDISPDNILLTSDMEPILIDFGAARQDAVKEERAQMRVVKDGYSPQEFYLAGAEQGAYSDLYALAATFYHLITGELPVNAQSRIASIAGGEDDPYVPLAGKVKGYSNTFLSAMDKALSTLPRDRFASADDWLAVLDGKQAAKSSGMSKATPTAATSAKPKPATKSRTRVLAAIGLAVPIMGGVYVMQSNSADPLEAVATPTAESTQASVDVAAAIPGLETASELTEQEAPASDLTALLSIEAAATGQPETALPEAGSLADENLSAALNLGASLEAAEPASELPAGIESFNLPQIQSAWTIDLTAVPADGIYAINGIALDAVGDVVDAVGDVDTALHQIMQPPEGSTLELSVLESNAETAAVIDTVSVPVIHRTSLPDGAVFEARMADDLWTTTVIKAPAESNFQVDDVLMGDLSTEQPFKTRASLPEALVQAYAQDADGLTLAVQRQGSIAAAGFLLPR